MDLLSPSSQTERPPDGKIAADVERDDLRGLLRAIREALDVPPGPRREALLDLRAARVVMALRAVLGDIPTAGIPWETEHLHKMLARDADNDAPVPYELTGKAETAVGS